MDRRRIEPERVAFQIGPHIENNIDLSCTKSAIRFLGRDSIRGDEGIETCNDEDPCESDGPPRETHPCLLR
jgi:hypothetical protein